MPKAAERLSVSKTNAGNSISRRLGGNRPCRRHPAGVGERPPIAVGCLLLRTGRHLRNGLLHLVGGSLELSIHLLLRGLGILLQLIGVLLRLIVEPLLVLIGRVL